MTAAQLTKVTLVFPCFLILVPGEDTCLQRSTQPRLASNALTSFFPNYRLLEIDISSNKLSHLPPGFLHLSKLQKLTASKNYLEKLFEEESGMFRHQ